MLALLEDSQGRLISTRTNWIALYELWSEMSDEELEAKGTSASGAIYSEQYVAGDDREWNTGNNRQEGDFYEGVCREICILNMRREKREKAQHAQEEAINSLVENEPPYGSFV